MIELDVGTSTFEEIVGELNLPLCQRCCDDEAKWISRYEGKCVHHNSLWAVCSSCSELIGVCRFHFTLGRYKRVEPL